MQRQEPINSYLDWVCLVDGLARHNRHVVDQMTLEQIREAVESAQRTLVAGTRLFRSRQGGELRRSTTSLEVASPHRADVMLAPPAEINAGGRLNPPGISYLYTSKSAKTAVAESRPWRGAKISVAELELTKDVKVFDFSEDPAEASTRAFILKMLGLEFSVPKDPELRHAYAPTQFLAEFLKWIGRREVSGVIYPSALDEDGRNVAFFGSADTRFEDFVSVTGNPVLYHVESVNVDFRVHS